MKSRNPGPRFADNARLKADFYSRLTGLDTLGDDSGLEVMALGGRPGVLSARYAGEGAGDDARIDKLLAEMKGIADRRARFVSAVCISRGGSPLASFTARSTGRSSLPGGGGGGFGYDPLFLYPPLGKTFAELTLAEKNRISHRARALGQAKKFLLLEGWLHESRSRSFKFAKKSPKSKTHEKGIVFHCDKYSAESKVNAAVCQDAGSPTPSFFPTATICLAHSGYAKVFS